MEQLRFMVSEFNINNASGFCDEEHIDLLKRQIENGEEISIDVYIEDSVYKVIDGGHTLKAYQALGRVPTKLYILQFETDADKIAYSRHKNQNRLRTAPIVYTKSLFMELKLRFGVENDDEMKSILNRFYNIRHQPENLLTMTERDQLIVSTINEVFIREPIKPDSFITTNLAFLDFPGWLADMVNKGRLSGNRARVINRLEVPDKQKQLLAERIIQEAMSDKEFNKLITPCERTPIKGIPLDYYYKGDRTLGESHHELTRSFSPSDIKGAEERPATTGTRTSLEEAEEVCLYKDMLQHVMMLAPRIDSSQCDTCELSERMKEICQQVRGLRLRDLEGGSEEKENEEDED